MIPALCEEIHDSKRSPSVPSKNTLKYPLNHSKGGYEKLPEEKGFSYIIIMDFSQGPTVLSVDTIHLNSADCLINLDVSMFR